MLLWCLGAGQVLVVLGGTPGLRYAEALSKGLKGVELDHSRNALDLFLSLSYLLLWLYNGQILKPSGRSRGLWITSFVAEDQGLGERAQRRAVRERNGLVKLYCLSRMHRKRYRELNRLVDFVHCSCYGRS